MGSGDMGRQIGESRRRNRVRTAVTGAVTAISMVLASCASDEQGRTTLAQSGEALGTPAAPAVPAFLAPTGEGVDIDSVAGSAGSDALLEEDPNDPLEGLNRYFFEINYALDETLFKAVAGWYRLALPQAAREGIRNALRNLRSPVILANDLFQGEFERAGVTFARFVVNSTAGLGGIFDVAATMGLEYHDEDFGQTLGAHGVDSGPYLMLPVLGPSNPRDLAGRVVDMFLDPIGYLAPAYGLDSLEYMRTGLTAADTRERNLETLDDVRRSSLDYYATVRSLYTQSRDAAIRNADEGLDGASGIFLDDDLEEDDFEALPESPMIEEEEPAAGEEPEPIMPLEDSADAAAVEIPSAAKGAQISELPEIY